MTAQFPIYTITNVPVEGEFEKEDAKLDAENKKIPVRVQDGENWNVVPNQYVSVNNRVVDGEGYLLDENGEKIQKTKLQDIPMVAAEAKGVGIGMAEDCRNGHAVVFDRPIRIDAIELAEICCDLAGLFVSGIEIGFISQPIFANLELDMGVIAGSFRSASASPRTVIPGHGLERGHSPVSQFADPAVKTCLDFLMVPVISVAVLSDQFDHLSSVLRIIIRLDITTEPRVIRAGAVPEDTLRGNLTCSLIAGALRHHAHSRFILIAVLHMLLQSPPVCGHKKCTGSLRCSVSYILSYVCLALFSAGIPGLFFLKLFNLPLC